MRVLPMVYGGPFGKSIRRRVSELHHGIPDGRLDEAVGEARIRLAGRHSRRAADPSMHRDTDVAVTLVLFPGALGDFICLLPTLAVLRQRHRGRPLVAVVQARLCDLACRGGVADAAVAIESRDVARLFVADAGPPDDLVPGRRVAAVYSWMASGDATVRANLERLADGDVHCLPFALPPAWAHHAARHFLTSAGIAAEGPPVGGCIVCTGAETSHALELMRARGLSDHRVLALHRGAGSVRKRWADAGFAAVSAWWRSNGGVVVEISGPADPPEPLHREHALVRAPALGVLAAVLALVDLFVGGDSGVAHLAGAVGATGVVIFGPTRARIWRPLGGRLVCLTAVETTGAGGISVDDVRVRQVIRTLGVLGRAASP